MKKIILFVSILTLIAIMTAACSYLPKGKTSLKDRKDSLSYVIGLQLGKNLDPSMVSLNYDKLVRGMQDVADTSKIIVKKDDIEKILMTFQAEMQLKAQQKQQKLGEENSKMQTQFFSKNKTNPDVVSTPEGLQYKILTKGSGPIPNDKSEITAKFVGKTLDGKEVFNSKDLPADFKFTIGQFIKGWDIALKLMPKGSKWELFIPDSLAFGPQGSRELGIGPNQGLIFNFELIDVK